MTPRYEKRTSPIIFESYLLSFPRTVFSEFAKLNVQFNKFIKFNLLHLCMRQIHRIFHFGFSKMFLEKYSLVSHNISKCLWIIFIHMKQMTFRVAKLLVDYMYTGYLGVNMTSVGQIINTSRQLGMEDVVQCCTLHLLNQLRVATWAQVCVSERSFTLRFKFYVFRFYDNI